MARFSRDGTFYIKTLSGIEVHADGAPYVAFAKAIPPFVAVNRYWVHGWYTGKDQMDPHEKQQIITSGRFGNIDIDVDGLTSWGTTGTGTGGATAQSNLNGFVGRYLPRGGGVAGYGQDWYDQDATDEAGTGLVGGATLDSDPDEGSGDDSTDLVGGNMSWQAKQREWLSDERMFGLGRNAIMTAADKIRFCGEFVKKGRVNGYGCNIDSWRLIAIDALTAVIEEEETDSIGTHLFGNSTMNPDLLMNQAYYFFGEQDARGAANITGMGGTGNPGASGNLDAGEMIPPPSGILTGMVGDDEYSGVGGLAGVDIWKWMTQGFGTEDNSTNEGSGLDKGSQLTFQLKVTLECKTIKPISRNVYTPN